VVDDLKECIKFRIWPIATSSTTWTAHFIKRIQGGWEFGNVKAWCTKRVFRDYRVGRRIRHEEQLRVHQDLACTGAQSLGVPSIYASSASGLRHGPCSRKHASTSGRSTCTPTPSSSSTSTCAAIRACSPARSAACATSTSTGRGTAQGQHGQRRVPLPQPDPQGRKVKLVRVAPTLRQWRAVARLHPRRRHHRVNCGCSTTRRLRIFNVGTGRAQSFNGRGAGGDQAPRAWRDRIRALPGSSQGRYQSYNPGGHLQAAPGGYTAEFMTVEQGVPRYLDWLQQNPA